MFRSAYRSVLRSPSTQSCSLAPARTRIATAPVNRFLSTAPPAHKRPRSWKSGAARWGLAVAAIYYYNTSELFADQPAEYQLDPKADYEDQQTSIMDASSPPSLQADQSQRSKTSTVSSEASRKTPAGSPEPTANHASESSPGVAAQPSASDPAELEEEASSEGAFNPETGEINWDCPCLGGMAHGPCGDDFKAAFSCFVFSEDEPKGINCIEKFQGMQECFRAHPEIYAAELAADDEDELDEGLEEERKGLVKEIQEKREQNKPTEEEPSRTKRLLEDDPPIERQSLLGRRSQPQQSSTSSTSSTSPTSSTSSPTPSPPSSDRGPSMTDDHDSNATSKLKSASRSRQSEPEPEPAEASSKDKVFDRDSELMPKPWHDGRSNTESGQEPRK